MKQQRQIQRRLMQSIGEHQEIPKGEAAVMSVRGLRKWGRVCNLAVERHQKPKERTRAYCGSQKRVTIADRMTRHAGVAWLGKMSSERSDQEPGGMRNHEMMKGQRDCGKVQNAKNA
jgi:hypothetical protein